MNQLIIGEPHPVAIAGINKLFTWILRTLLGIEYIYIYMYIYIYVYIYIYNYTWNECNATRCSTNNMILGSVWKWGLYIYISSICVYLYRDNDDKRVNSSCFPYFQTDPWYKIGIQPYQVSTPCLFWAWVKIQGTRGHTQKTCEFWAIPSTQFFPTCFQGMLMYPMIAMQIPCIFPLVGWQIEDPPIEPVATWYYIWYATPTSQQSS